MTKFKHIALALATAGLLATQAHAGEAQTPTLHQAPLPAFSQQDIGSLFDQAAQPMQLAVLSDAEMRETEGAAHRDYGLEAVEGHCGRAL